VSFVRLLRVLSFISWLHPPAEQVAVGLLRQVSLLISPEHVRRSLSVGGDQARFHPTEREILLRVSLLHPPRCVGSDEVAETGLKGDAD
jgi:hypothetical protein